MNLDATRGFLAALAHGAELTAALRVGEASPSIEGRSFLAARRALEGGASVEEAMSVLTGAPPIVRRVFASAPVDKRPAAAEHLWSALRMARLRPPGQFRLLEHQIRLYAATVNAMALLVVSGLIYLQFSALLATVTNDETNVLLLTAVVTILLGGGFAAGQLITTFSASARLNRPPSVLLLMLAAVAEAEVPFTQVAQSLSVGRAFRLSARRREEQVFGSPADHFVNRGWISARVAAIAKYRWAADTAGAPWARAAAIADHEQPSLRAEWPTYASMGLSALGAGTAVIAVYRALLQLTEVVS